MQPVRLFRSKQEGNATPRAYSMLHTAVYDAWSAFDGTALRVSFDLEGDNEKPGNGTTADKEKAMNFATITVLREVFPDMEALFLGVFEDRYGFDDGDMSYVAEDLIALCANDGSSFENDYADTTG